MEDWITSKPGILGGKPIIRGTRISVAFLLELFASGWTVEQILEGYPHLTREGILAALRYSAEVLHGEQVLSLSDHT
jgi:uncharacterized protein (DUF433 family)